MQADVTEYLTCVLMVIAELRATIVMMPGMNCIDTLKSSFLNKQLGKFVRDTIDTTYSRHNPYLITYAYIAIGPFIAKKCAVGKRYLQLLVNRRVCIFKSTLKVGFKVVLVYPFTSREVCCRMTYRVSIFYYVFSASRIFYKNLVAHRNVMFDCNVVAVNGDYLTFTYRLKAYDNRVGRIDFDKS